MVDTAFSNWLAILLMQNQPDFSLVTFKGETLKRAAVDGWPQVWWNNQTVVLPTETNSFLLYNVPSGKMTVLISARVLESFIVGLHNPDVSAA